MKAPDLARAPVPFMSSLRWIAGEIDREFGLLLAEAPDQRCRLQQAMRHAAIGGGKRLRPLLVVASAELFGVSRHHAVRAGLAAECVHVQSLIHDDLPCMDDDDLRRGKPTVHRAFGEATAVLAGDALLALAFEILANPGTHPAADVRIRLVGELARAAGADGMAGGQILDLLPADGGLDIDAVTRLQQLKTGALIGWCVEAGAVMGGAPAEARIGLRGYAQCLGLAFQITDDLLDRDGIEEKVGKRLRKDEAQGKETFVSLLGAEAARRQAKLLAAQAIDHLRSFGATADLLREVARLAVDRDH